MTRAPGGRDVPVFVVVPPHALLLDVAGPVEVLRRASQLQDQVRFGIQFVAPAPAVRSSVGLVLAELAPLPPALPPDAMVVVSGSVDDVLVPGSGARPGLRWARPGPEGRAHARAIVEWLRAVVDASHLLVTICSGALLAARAGLLDGHACTTHYSDCEELARLAPRARVLADRLFVEDGRRLTSAGVTAGIDLMLHLVAQLAGTACAVAVARYLVVYLRRSGAEPQHSPWLEGRNHLHPVVHRMQDAMTAEPTRRWTLAALARVAGASPRHVSRLFGAHAGMSIAEYRTRLRATLAAQLMGSTAIGLERVADLAGFGSARQLRRAWQKLHRAPPRSYRAGGARAA
jgi:transcriptional regulator GlxA family with amidase domain